MRRRAASLLVSKSAKGGAAADLQNGNDGAIQMLAKGSNTFADNLIIASHGQPNAFVGLCRGSHHPAPYKTNAGRVISGALGARQAVR